MSWTDERVETLKRMWIEGQSASQIAKELGGVTRNAVIGKIHRLGMSNRATGGEAENDPGAGTAPAPAEITRNPGAATSPPTDATASEPQADPAAGDPPPTSEEDARPGAPVPGVFRRVIVPAGQPLPPQPSASEISPEALASVREIEKQSCRLTLMELTERTCKWPIGDPATEEFWFCGLPSQAGKPYCEAHVGVAFQPMSARRDRRR